MRARACRPRMSMLPPETTRERGGVESIGNIRFAEAWFYVMGSGCMPSNRQSRESYTIGDSFREAGHLGVCCVCWQLFKPIELVEP
jgi:hypothetical protein